MLRWLLALVRFLFGWRVPGVDGTQPDPLVLEEIPSSSLRLAPIKSQDILEYVRRAEAGLEESEGNDNERSSGNARCG
jgi:hypothetical protein